jgi:hypothetical protein
VKIVSGWLLRSRRAAMTEGMRSPPKEFRDLGRLNCSCQRLDREAESWKGEDHTVMIPIFPLISNLMSGYWEVDMMGGSL